MRNRNLIGQMFSDLLVIDRSDPIIRPSGKKSAWLCMCKCGKEVIVTQNALISGTTKSCGCRNADNGVAKRKDLTGQRFGKLVVKSFDHIHTTPNGSKKTYWLCECDCSNHKVVQGSALLSGYITSCGCVRSQSISDRTTQNLIGQQFGLLTVVKRVRKQTVNRHAVWLCKCDCGAMKEVSSDSLLSGHTSSCGCLGASTGEYWISKILDQFYVPYEREYSFDDLTGPNGGLLRFDFAIFDNEHNLLGLIEYQGEQHYLEKKKDFGALQRNVTDEVKRLYCDNHKIPLIEIAYSDQLIKSLQKALKTLHANPVPRLGNK